MKALPAEIHQVGESEKVEAGETLAEVFDMDADGKEGDGSGSCWDVAYQSARASFVGQHADN